MRRVKNGDWVKIHYVCSLENGKIVDSSEGFPPVEFQVGSRLDQSGFGRSIIGMGINEEKEFTLLPDNTFGCKVKDKIKEIPLSQLKSEVKPKAGMVMLFNVLFGPKLPGTVVKVKKHSMIVDFNHPLTGKKLMYKVKVLEIKERKTHTFPYRQ